VLVAFDLVGSSVLLSTGASSISIPCCTHNCADASGAAPPRGYVIDLIQTMKSNQYRFSTCVDGSPSMDPLSSHEQKCPASTDAYCTYNCSGVSGAARPRGYVIDSFE
jgi:hypothetical protein